jgi:adenosylhomocysteine nucleosidase
MRRPTPLVLVCFAVGEEGRFFSASDLKDCGATVLYTGMGRANARRAVERALACSRPDLVLSCGFAGALNPSLQVGTVLYSAEAGSPLDEALSSLGAVRARFHCASRVASTATEKGQLRASTGADAVEMESGAIGELCHGHGISCGTVRAISDAANEDLPLDFNRFMTQELKLSYPRLLWAVLTRPQRIPGLLRLQRQTLLAAQNLGRTLCELLEKRGSALW